MHFHRAHSAIAAFALVGALSMASTANAVDVENEDGKPYKVTLQEPGAAKTEITVNAGEKKLDLCAACTVTVEGMQPVSGSGLDRVVIKDGKATLVE